MNKVNKTMTNRLRNEEIFTRWQDPTIEQLQQENKQLKEVIEELRECIEDWLFNVGGNGASMTYEDINELLQILDKVIGDDK